MAKEIVTWCEVHLQSKEERVPGVEHRISLDGTAVIVDLCEDCRTQFITPLDELINTYGQEAPAMLAQPAKKKSSATNKWTPDANGVFHCAKCPRTFTTPQGMGRHAVYHETQAAG